MEVSDAGCQVGKHVDSKEDLECVICFDDVAQQVELPCRCNLSYCHRCWDRSMAQSLNSNGRSRCPTCRSAVRVDFDAERGMLLFSHEDENVHISRDEITERLAQQASPSQARILREYGEARPVLGQLAEEPVVALAGASVRDLKRHIEALSGSIVGCTERRDLVERLQEASVSPEALVAYWAAAGDASAAQPFCVCGSTLRRVTGRERNLEFARKLEPNFAENTPMFEDFLRRLSDGYTSSGVICDMCDMKVPYTACLWTCENGDATVLHAMSYDVCDRCFALNACPGLISSDSE